MIMTGVLVAAAITAQPAPDLSQLSVFATIERRPSSEATTRVRIGTFEGPIIAAGEKVTYWLEREREDRPRRVIDRAVADSGTCPASLAAIRSLEHLRLPPPDVPGYRRDFNVIVTDGTGYRLEGTSRHPDGQGKYSITSNTRTPLAKWTERLFRAVEGCWKPIP